MGAALLLRDLVEQPCFLVLGQIGFGEPFPRALGIVARVIVNEILGGVVALVVIRDERHRWGSQFSDCRQLAHVRLRSRVTGFSFRQFYQIFAARQSFWANCSSGSASHSAGCLPEIAPLNQPAAAAGSALAQLDSTLSAALSCAGLQGASRHNSPRPAARIGQPETSPPMAFCRASPSVFG